MLDNITDITSDQREELENYSSQISQLADGEDGIANGIVFTNEGKYHAAIVISKILEKTKKSIKMFAGDFNGDVSDMYLKSLRNFLKSGEKNVEIIFEKDPNSDSKALSIIKEYSNCNNNTILIKVACQKAINDLRSHVANNKLIHFIVGDEKMYRCETDTENYKATGSFNDSTFSNVLLFLFEGLKSDAKTFPLQ